LALIISNIKNIFTNKYTIIGLIAYPALLISMIYLAYGHFNFQTTDIFTITIVNNDMEGMPQPEDRYTASLLFIDALYSNQYDNTFVIEGNNTHTLGEAMTLLNSNSIQVIIEINENFSEAVYGVEGYQDQQPTVNMITTDDVTIITVMGVIVYDNINQILINVTGAPKADISSQKVGDTYYTYTVFDLLVPGIIIGAISIVLTLLAIVIGREKEFQTLQRLLTTPVKKRTILFSLMITQFIAAIIQLIIVLLLAVAFGAHISPNVNWGMIFVVAILFNLSSMGIGLFLGSFVKNGKSAGLISFFVAFTMMMVGNIVTPPGELSGSAFVPNSYAVDAIRNIMLYGKYTLNVIGIDLFALLLFGIITIILGLISFNRKHAIT